MRFVGGCAKKAVRLRDRKELAKQVVAEKQGSILA